MVFLAIDPGREKCGWALFSDTGGLLEHAVAAREDVGNLIKEKAELHNVKVIIIGNGTGSNAVVQEIRQLNLALRIELVDEYKTTEQAKKRYWQENPPKGWRKLIPLGLQVPPEPVDDYVAIIIGEKYQKK